MKLLGVSSFVTSGQSYTTTAPAKRTPATQQTSALHATGGRRQVLQSVFTTGAAFVGSTTISHALDMDAFMNSELESDTKGCNPKTDPKCKPKLSNDEALCKYGNSGNARAEACKRVKATGGELPSANQGKSLGGAYAM